MLFNSILYLIFLSLVLMVYYGIPARRRWMLLLGASYLFYMSWQPEYALLLAISTGVDYWAGLKMAEKENKSQRRPWLLLSLLVNLGFLISFKYLDFLAECFNFIFVNIGFEGVFLLPGWVLPIGISFYTFQSLSYSIDIYRGDRKAEKHIGIFALYVSFFPQLISGPIERASALLPQFYEKHRFQFENISRGGALILWGLFQKLAVADNLNLYVTEIFNNPESYSGAPVLLGIYFFAMQVYCDFAGYTNIAIGSAAMFGIRLSENFRRPYLATSIREFWNRWHITLTTWMRDYLYIGLGGNRKGFWRQQLNLYLVFLAVAIWHGTDTKLVLFGTLHYTFYLAQEQWRSPANKFLSYFSFKNSILFQKILPIFITFHLVAFSWVIWWATDLESAVQIVYRALIFENYTWENINILSETGVLSLSLIGLIILQLVYVLQGYNSEIYFLNHRSRKVRWMVFYGLIFGILFLNAESGSEAFIYFQF